MRNFTIPKVLRRPESSQAFIVSVIGHLIFAGWPRWTFPPPYESIQSLQLTRLHTHRFVQHVPLHPGGARWSSQTSHVGERTEYRTVIVVVISSVNSVPHVQQVIYRPILRYRIGQRHDGMVYFKGKLVTLGIDTARPITRGQHIFANVFARLDDRFHRLRNVESGKVIIVVIVTFLDRDSDHR